MKKSVCSLLALVMTLVLVTAASDPNSPLINITAVLGGSATIRCPWESSDPVIRLYIQRHIKDKDEEFINGFDEKLPLIVPVKYLNRTKVNKANYSMEMTDVSVSDEGFYKCIFFNGLPNPTVSRNVPRIYLKVTANYNVPTLEKKCSKHGGGAAGKSCQLSCSSVGGYPQSAVKWAGLNTSLLRAVHNDSLEDPISKTWTVNQTVTYNCDQPTNVSCAVGGAVSPDVTVCDEELFSMKVAAAVVIVIVFVLLLILISVVMNRCSKSNILTQNDSCKSMFLCLESSCFFLLTLLSVASAKITSDLPFWMFFAAFAVITVDGDVISFIWPNKSRVINKTANRLLVKSLQLR